MNNEIKANTSPKKEKKTSSASQHRAMSAILVVIFILAFAGVNVLAVFLVNRFPALEIDLTSDGAFSLQSTTEEYLEYMDETVKVKVLLSEEALLAVADDNGSATYSYQVNQLLREMSRYDSIDLEYLDLTATSTKALTEKYPDVDWSSSDNLIIVENQSGDKYKLLKTSDVFSYDSEYAYYYGSSVMNGQYLEQEVLTAIQRVTSNKTIKVALSVGNGEVVNPESAAYQSFSYISVLLDDNAYDVETVNLLTQEIPEDADILIMLAPAYDITADTADNLSSWLENGGEYGKTFFYVPYDYAGDTPNIDLFLEQWGMSVTYGYINENDTSKTLSSGNPPELYNLVDYANDTYTAGLKDTSKQVLTPFCMPVEILDSEMAAPLLTSSDKASIRVPSSTADETADAEYIQSDGEALNAAVISEKSNDNDQKSNVIVWGSYDALSIYNLYYYSANYNNSEYVVNLFNTITENDAESIVVQGIALGGQYMTVTSAQQVAVLVIFVFLVPIGLAVVGIVIWVRRRNR
ncbi:MAG: Gldg family protein [Ruminococcus sp.]